MGPFKRSWDWEEESKSAEALLVRGSLEELEIRAGEKRPLIRRPKKTQRAERRDCMKKQAEEPL